MRRTDLEGLPFLPTGFPLPLDAPFTRSTAHREGGLTPHQLAWLVEQGFLRRLLRNVYVATPVADSLDLRCAALRLVVPQDAVVCDRHAGWLHGAEMVLAPNEHLNLAPIRVFLPAPGRRLRNVLADSGERTFARDDVVELNGLRVTSPLRTTWDLGRQRYAEPSLAAMDQMLRLGLFSAAELAAGVPRFKGMRWVTVLRTMVAYVDGRAESPPESILRLRWIQAHLPTPVPQLEVFDAVGTFLARLDLGTRRWRSLPSTTATSGTRAPTSCGTTGSVARWWRPRPRSGSPPCARRTSSGRVRMSRPFFVAESRRPGAVVARSDEKPPSAGSTRSAHHLLPGRRDLRTTFCRVSAICAPLSAGSADCRSHFAPGQRD
ncbi:hypothetical protein QI633_08560 [Nocardioides sp. QY071]|uniref:hypothetical protein n=1 Tax=Nocardioides sp. QY071 TaxID=3044187 RepID=UPI00249B57A0|nr:hypothetical protein [Nocardioides sp. QY071]WGY03804.1 hypothetical protein QI633_08560 [Nocardioides sp. QY071]